MTRKIISALTILLLAACAPPGYEDAAFTSVSWPDRDTAVSPQQRVEIEQHLAALGYLKERPDGAISRSTRNAIRLYQADIGAPASGYVSAPLLDSLRLNSGGVAPVQASPVPVRTSTSSTTSSTAPSSTPTGATGDGGAGGSSAGGAWN